MWSCLTQDITRACKMVRFNSNILGNTASEDVGQNVLLYLLEHPDTAELLLQLRSKDERKSMQYLIRLVKAEIFDMQAKSQMVFASKDMYSRYQRVVKVCEKYNIEPVPENAYKIAGIMDDDKTFSIAIVASLLEEEKKRPEMVPFEAIIDELADVSKWV